MQSQITGLAAHAHSERDGLRWSLSLLAGNCEIAKQWRMYSMLYTEFVRWFGADIAGPPEHYKRIASEI
jgi:hypothetical protein